jgi:hypothetical protein
LTPAIFKNNDTMLYNQIIQTRQLNGDNNTNDYIDDTEFRGGCKNKLDLFSNFTLIEGADPLGVPNNKPPKRYPNIVQSTQINYRLIFI